MEWNTNSILEHFLLYSPTEPLLFTSGIFLFWFLLFYAVYVGIYQQKKFRTLWVILFSFFFYYKSSGFYLIILLFSIVLDYWVALKIYRTPNRSHKKAWLVLSIVSNISLLGYFKYTNFLLGTYYNLLKEPFEPLDIFLPIGISFYTFQTISYIVDVYQGKIEPTKNLLDYTFYMSFFPHLVAGPIVRARDFLPQIYQKVVITKEKVHEGLWLILKGFIKKAIVADYLAQYNDLVFGAPGQYSGFENAMGMYGYAMQIYCDFSGYSDMAIGLALLMGFRLLPNFNSPYVSLSITEFWRRWHLSLSHWLRDYVYISQGGNQKGPFWQSVFLMNTMLIGGLWHGADWKFILWGGMHGLALVMHKYLQPFTKSLKHNLWNALAWLITFHSVAFLWVYFRARSFNDASLFLYNILSNLDFNYALPFLHVRYLFVLILLGAFTLHVMPNPFKIALFQRFCKIGWIGQFILFIVSIQVMLQLRSQNVQPFIYFQF